jgi:hypothetical protein
MQTGKVCAILGHREGAHDVGRHQAGKRQLTYFVELAQENPPIDTSARSSTG